MSYRSWKELRNIAYIYTYLLFAIVVIISHQLAARIRSMG